MVAQRCGARKKRSLGDRAHLRRLWRRLVKKLARELFPVSRLISLIIRFVACSAEIREDTQAKYRKPAVHAHRPVRRPHKRQTDTKPI